MISACRRGWLVCAAVVAAGLPAQPSAAAPRSLLVRPAPARVVSQLARDALLSVLPFVAERVRVLSLRVPPIRLRGRPQRARAELKANERFRGPTTFALVIESDDPNEEPARVWATADLRVRTPTVILARDLPRGHTVRAEDVSVVLRDLGGALRGTLTAAKDAVGQVLRRSMAMFAPLRAADLDRPKLVDRGALVMLVVRSGGLVVTARAQTLQEGRRGDTIRAKNLSSGKTVLGRVDDASRIVVEASF